MVQLDRVPSDGGEARKTASSFLARHYTFLLIFLLFLSFRLLAILLLRPGGLISDFSDYDFYYTWGQLTPMGYRAYDNLWTAYPPLFPAIMLPVFELSSRVPPWVEPRLFFHLFFGLALLAFDAGNLLLVYRLSQRLESAEWTSGCLPLAPPLPRPHFTFRIPQSALLYALFFVPVYTMLGWFEPMPLFFMLLGLELLLSGWRGSWVASAVVVGLGFLVKLTPALLVPVAIAWLGAKLSWRAARDEWFRSRAAGNLLRPALYVLFFVGVVIGIGYPLVATNPALALSSFRIQSIRPPWQSVWALIDGFYGYGLVPLDMRNLVGFEGQLWESRIPWGWVTLGFVVVYLWLYTRGYDWQQPRTVLAFSAISVIWLFLYSKGWSPQFLLWILLFIALLLPNLYGVCLAIMLSLINFVEANVFLIMLPDERWIMQATVLVRTALLILIAVEFLGQIWPVDTRGFWMRRISMWSAWGVMALALAGSAFGAPRAAQAYSARMLAQHPCREAIAFLQEQALWPNRTIASEQIEVWRDFYPWLREQYEFRILDRYSPADRDPVAVIGDQLTTLAAAGEFWWVERLDPVRAASSLLTAEAYFARDDVHVLDRQAMGECTLQRIVWVEPPALAVADVAGGPIRLADVAVGRAVVGADLHLVLYWLADAPVAESYTVFTQLLDAAGHLVVQQDNLPVAGLAPTNTWQADTIIRDPYRLMIPADAAPGTYQLIIGLYTADGRRALALPDGRVSDSLSFRVDVE